ncbi:MAG TPA: ArsB/NhaD family transporter [Nitrospiria bacterium]
MQPALLTVPIFLITVYLALTQPRIGRLRIDHAKAAVMGAILALLLIPGSSREVLSSSLEILVRPLITISSLMIITLIAEQAGLFDRLLRSIMSYSRGSGNRLFGLLFLTGVLAGAVFTNDAAVLILTPLVCLMSRNWVGLQPLPYLFAVLNVANLVGAFVISNPINIIVAEFFGVGFLNYVKWMILPALTAALTTFFILKAIFRREITDSRFTLKNNPAADEPASSFLKICTGVLALTLIALFLGAFYGIPVWAVTAVGALTLMVLARAKGGIQPATVLRGVGWDVLIFMVGFFIIINTLSQTGLPAIIAGAIQAIAGDQPGPLILTTGFISAFCSALMNNHPTAYIMALSINEIATTPAFKELLVFAMLIGGDLGPKMLPIGSLAALLWFRILRNHGTYVPYTLYIKIGIPVTLSALLLSLLVLIAESALWGTP